MKNIRNISFLLIIISLSACTTNPTPQPILPTTDLASPSTTVFPEVIEAPTQSVVETMPAVTQYGLDGRLVLIQYNQTGNRLIELNLQSGEIRSLFQAPENSWLSEAVVSPDNQQIILAYSPPPPGDEPQFGYTDLFLVAYHSAAQPVPFRTRTHQNESFFFPSWAPDSRSVYYTHLYPTDENSQIPEYQNDVELASFKGEKKTIIGQALWPAVSPDGSKISFLYVNPATFSNDLYLANLDGSSQTPIIATGTNPPIDAHLFTKDGNRIIFSMVNAQPAPVSSWLDKIFGVEIALAHNVPSDWYSIPVSGGSLLRLTNLEDVNLSGDLSPDGNKMAFISASGLYIMDIDGSNLIQLSNEIFIGTAEWIP